MRPTNPSRPLPPPPPPRRRPGLSSSIPEQQPTGTSTTSTTSMGSTASMSAPAIPGRVVPHLSSPSHHVAPAMGWPPASNKQQDLTNGSMSYQNNYGPVRPAVSSLHGMNQPSVQSPPPPLRQQPSTPKQPFHQVVPPPTFQTHQQLYSSNASHNVPPLPPTHSQQPQHANYTSARQSLTPTVASRPFTRQDKDKIDPSQIPRIPLFTRPHHAPATIYPLLSTPSPNTCAIAVGPPPADSRYTTFSINNTNTSPRIMRSTVHAFPLDKATSRKCDLPLGLTITPFAGLTTLCRTSKPTRDDSSRHEPSNRDKSNHPLTRTKEWEYIPLIEEDTPDPERIPVLLGPKRRVTRPNSDASFSYSTVEQTTRSIVPPRCNKCRAYLNPFCTSLQQPPPQPQQYLNFLGTTYSPVQSYNCSICGASNSISIPDEYIADGTVNAALQCGTVEYEVGGEYCVRDQPVQNVRLYAVEYTTVMEEDAAGRKRVKSRDWCEALQAIMEVAKALRFTAPSREEENGWIRTSPVKVGLFAFCGDMLVFPHIKAQGEQEDFQISVAVVSDVVEDPFCPLPLSEWTYDVGGGNDREWRQFCHVIDSFSEIMEMLTSESMQSDRTTPTIQQPWRKEENMWMLNAGGAALAALADALRDSGGRATLITSGRPSYGVGSLRDREAGQQSHYLRSLSEKRLFTPLQCLSFKDLSSSNASEEQDRQAGMFYRNLGENCAKWRVCIDIVLISSLLSLPTSSMGQLSGSTATLPNLREFVDVATLTELCRVTCGKFSWLRVGNECGISVDESTDGNCICTFSGEQLREELIRTALAYSGNDVVFKLRCSNGIQVKSYSPISPIGTLVGDSIVDSTELELSSMNSSTTIAVTLEHNIGGIVNTRERGTTAPMVFFQSAVLYTTLTGRRRVRVSTLGLSTTKVPADVFRSADFGTVVTIMTRQAVSDLNHPNEGSLKFVRDNVFQKCVSILANYRLHTTAKTSPSGQLILPESLQLLPLFCLSLRKSRMFRHCLQLNAPSAKPFPTADERAYHIFYASMVSPNFGLHFCHPNLLLVSDMRSRDGEWLKPDILQEHKFIEDEVISASMRPVCQLPKSMNPSITCLDESGMYILDDLFSFYLFIGKDVPTEKWRDLVSLQPTRDGQNTSTVPVGALSLASTTAGQKVRSILRQLRMHNSPNPTLSLNVRPTYAPLILVLVGHGSVFEEEMDSLLIDDPDTHEKSYVDFLCAMHSAIRDINAKTG